MVDDTVVAHDGVDEPLRMVLGSKGRECWMVMMMTRGTRPAVQPWYDLR